MFLRTELLIETDLTYKLERFIGVLEEITSLHGKDADLTIEKMEQTSSIKTIVITSEVNHV